MNSNWPQGVDRLILDEVDSTNTHAANLGREGAGPLWVLARTQANPRGRRGRVWRSWDDNFAASYLVWPKRPLNEIAQMSFVAALALFDTVFEFTRSDKLGLKWPNDLLLEDGKLSGILLETVESAGAVGLVIGIGVNLRHAPEAAEMEAGSLPATALSAVSGTIDPIDFLDLLAPNMERWQAIWQEDGFGVVREKWLARAIGLGTNIVARLPNAQFEGVFEDIDVNGSLVLRTRGSAMVLPATDVYFAKKPSRLNGKD